MNEHTDNILEAAMARHFKYIASYIAQNGAKKLTSRQQRRLTKKHRRDTTAPLLRRQP